QAHLYVVLRRWREAEEALRDRARVMAGSDREAMEPDCVRRTLRLRAGARTALDDSEECRVLGADLEEPGRRARRLGDIGSMHDEHGRELAALLLMEGGEEIPEDARLWLWPPRHALQPPPPYPIGHTGLHAAALAAYDRRHAREPIA